MQNILGTKPPTAFFSPLSVLLKQLLKQAARFLLLRRAARSSAEAKQRQLAADPSCLRSCLTPSCFQAAYLPPAWSVTLVGRDNEQLEAVGFSPLILRCSRTLSPALNLIDFRTDPTKPSIFYLQAPRAAYGPVAGTTDTCSTQVGPGLSRGGAPTLSNNESRTGVVWGGLN